jgi:hypothetical protein
LLFDGGRGGAEDAAEREEEASHGQPHPVPQPPPPAVGVPAQEVTVEPLHHVPILLVLVQLHLLHHRVTLERDRVRLAPSGGGGRSSRGVDPGGKGGLESNETKFEPG